MSIQLDFSKQTVLVVGGTSGINRRVAEMFAEQGAQVAVASRDPKKVADTVKKLHALGAEAMGFSADVRDADAIDEGIKSVHQQYGEFDVLVSGAAGNFPALAENLTPNGFKSVVDIDLRGTFHVMHAAFPYLKKPGASLINISAPQATIPVMAQIHVAAAKAGVDVITRNLALEWGRHGIRINSVVPGPIADTEGMSRVAPTDEAMEQTARSVPLGRLGTGDDIGNACLFLASDLASYISGAILPVDGAWATNGLGGMSDHLATLVEA
ncbi:MAG: SDR family oxidoreductase [Gammaproteobacteria bacterium]|nr:SDR family oxidoreductase [Gammaproteobacteria bacterium]